MRKARATLQDLMHLAISLDDHDLEQITGIARYCADFRNADCAEKRCRRCNRYFRGPRQYCCWSCAEKVLSDTRTPGGMGKPPPALTVVVPMPWKLASGG